MQCHRFHISWTFLNPLNQYQSLCCITYVIEWTLVLAFDRAFLLMTFASALKKWEHFVSARSFPWLIADRGNLNSRLPWATDGPLKSVSKLYSRDNPDHSVTHSLTATCPCEWWLQCCTIFLLYYSSSVVPPHVLITISSCHPPHFQCPIGVHAGDELCSQHNGEHDVHHQQPAHQSSAAPGARAADNLRQPVPDLWRWVWAVTRRVLICQC